MPYTQQIDECLAPAIGRLGLSGADMDELAALSAIVLRGVSARYSNPNFPLFRLPEKVDDLAAMTAVADRYRGEFSDVVVLGTGGSSLGGEALCDMGRKGAPGPRVHIVTNVDPFGFNQVMRGLDLTRTGWLVISKSGGTAETLMQFMSILPLLRDRLGETALPRHVAVITEFRDSPLMRLAKAFALPVLEHDPNVGGRYSVLSVVGMLPALIAGLDPRAVRAGANHVLQKTLATRPGDALSAEPIAGAAVSVGLNLRRDIQGTVMLAYSDRLGSLCRWYRQLWAESLGKDGKGTTPIYGTGPVDQHSQLQLWLDGPDDKMFTVIGAKPDPADALSNVVAPNVSRELAEIAGMDYFAERTLADLMDASRRGTAETLAEHGKPVRRIDLATIDEFGMGALMMHFMIETVASAHLLNVDPFDQPAVEHGKKLTRAYLAEMQEGARPAARAPLPAAIPA